MKEYNIETLNDLIKAADNSGNIDDLFVDLYAYVGFCIEMRKVMPDMSESKFIWIDDGKHNASINIKTLTKGEQLP